MFPRQNSNVPNPREILTISARKEMRILRNLEYWLKAKEHAADPKLIHVCLWIQDTVTIDHKEFEFPGPLKIDVFKATPLELRITGELGASPWSAGSVTLTVTLGQRHRPTITLSDSELKGWMEPVKRP
ncbi:MAG: hypothetical protein Q8P33_01570 [bacterium]|nr:hypothetical protein [bacterium]